jgi:hypothetical protein
MTVLLMVVGFSTFAQHGLYLGGGFGTGFLMNSYKEGKSLLGVKSPAMGYNFQLMAQYRIARRLFFEGGFSQQTTAMKFKDKEFEDANPGFVNNMKFRASYFSFDVGAGYAHPIQPTLFLYGQAMMKWNFAGGGSEVDSAYFPFSDENLKLSTNFSSGALRNFGLEAGVQLMFQNRHFIGAGLRYMLPTRDQALAEGTYTSSVGGVVQRSDEFEVNGSAITLQLKYLHLLGETEKRTPEPKVPKKPDPKPDPTPVVKVDTLDEKIAGRVLTVTHKMDVSATKVIIKVWDHQQVDGDIVSLNLNGVWVLQNHTLAKQAYVFEVTLKPGENLLVLHALNLGKYSPNTAAVQVIDGTKTQQVILESTLQTSGTIEINCYGK